MTTPIRRRRKKAIGQKAKSQHGKPQQNGNGKSDTAKPRGGQKGHKGATYRPAPTRFERHAPDRCPRCGMSDLTVTKTSKRNVTEIPPPPKAVTTQHVLETCSCNVCGLGESGQGRRLRMWTRAATRPFLNPPEDRAGAALPKRANYGMNVILKVAENFLQRMPHRMSAKSLRRHLTRMSHGTVHNILCMTGTNLDAPARQILDLIRLARVLHVDETSLSLNGKLVWVWIFFDPETGNTLFVIRPSRGGDVLREVIPNGMERSCPTGGARTRNTASSGAGRTYCARSGISPTGIPTARRRKTRWPSCPACTGAGSGRADP